MQFTRLVIAAAAVALAAGCSSGGSKKTPAAVSSPPAPSSTSSSSASPAPSTSPTYGAAWTASCGQFDTAMAVAYQDISKMQTGHATVNFMPNDLRISKSSIEIAAADAPMTLAGHESDVAKSLDTLAAKIDAYQSGTLEVGVEILAVRSAEQIVETDCSAASYVLKNMVAAS